MARICRLKIYHKSYGLEEITSRDGKWLNYVFSLIIESRVQKL